MIRTLLAAAVAAPWVLWAVVRVRGGETSAALTSALSFTPYAALTAIVPVVVALLLRRRLVALAALIPAVALMSFVVPRATGGADAATARTPRLTVMSVNLHIAGADPADVLRLAREHDVDVLAVQESDPVWIERFDEAGGLAVFPHLRAQPEDEALFSRRRMGATGVRSLPEGDVALGDATLRFSVIHPRPPLSGVWMDSWREELVAIPDADDVPRGTVRVLVGDFNATLDHAELRNVLARGYRDAANTVGAGLKPTWPAGRRYPPLITIDHVLTSGDVRVLSFDTLAVRDTDHRAIVVELAAP